MILSMGPPGAAAHTGGADSLPPGSKRRKHDLAQRLLDVALGLPLEFVGRRCRIECFCKQLDSSCAVLIGLARCFGRREQADHHLLVCAGTSSEDVTFLRHVIVRDAGVHEDVGVYVPPGPLPARDPVTRQPASLHRELHGVPGSAKGDRGLCGAYRGSMRVPIGSEPTRRMRLRLAHGLRVLA